MRPSTRLLARYLEAGQPTGLTGLWTHRSPRSTLLYLYDTTLDKLKAVPETSLYRQSVEAVTKHRMDLVKQYTPPGHEEWAAKARELVKNNSSFRVASGRKDGSEARTVKLGDRVFIVGTKHESGDIRTEEWDGEDASDSFGPELTPEQYVDNPRHNEPGIRLTISLGARRLKTKLARNMLLSSSRSWLPLRKLRPLRRPS